MTICTRILYARCADPADMERLKATCRAVGKMRAAIWQRWGGLGTIGKTANEVRREITAAQPFKHLKIDGTVRNRRRTSSTIFLRTERPRKPRSPRRSTDDIRTQTTASGCVRSSAAANG